MQDTDATWMKNSNKMVYMGHRRFLSMAHPYRKNKKSFYGKIEDRPAPWTLFAKDINKSEQTKSHPWKWQRKQTGTEVCYVKKEIDILGSALLVVLGCLPRT